MLAVKPLIPAKTIFRRYARLMGVDVEIGVVSDNVYAAEESIAAAFAEMGQVERLLSVFYDESAVNIINRNAGLSPVKISPDLFNLTSRLKEIFQLTNGTFDITYSSPGSKKDTTGNADIERPKKSVSYKQIELNAIEQTVFLRYTYMRVGFGSVIKGYAADRAKYILQLNGVSSGFIRVKDVLLTWGYQPNNQPWTIPAINPDQALPVLSKLNISNMAITFVFNPAQSSTTARPLLNTICPENGFHVSSINNVYVLSTTAEMATAMTAPLTAMGINAGLYLVNQLNQIACIYTDDQDRVYTSMGLSL